MNKTQKIRRLGWALTGGLLLFSVQPAYPKPKTPREKTIPAPTLTPDRSEVGGYTSDEDGAYEMATITQQALDNEKVLVTLRPGPERERRERDREQFVGQGDAVVAGCTAPCPSTLTNGALMAAKMGEALKSPEFTAKAHGLADRAVVAAEQATNDPKQADKLANALTTRGSFLEKAGEFERAHADARYALKVKPGDMAALGLLNLTKGRVKAGTVPVAWHAPPKPTNTPPPQSVNLNNDPRLAANAQNLAAMARLREARHLLDINDKNGALQMAQSIRSSDPGINAAAYAVQAQAWQVMGDLSKAVLQISEAIKLFTEKSDLAAAYAQRASYHNGLKNHEAAVADSSIAIENNPKLALAFRERSLAFEGLREPEKALDDMNQAAALDKGFMTELGEQRLRLGRGGGSAGLVPPAESTLHKTWVRLRGKAGGSFTLFMGAMGALSFLIAGYVFWFAKEGSAVSRFRDACLTPFRGAQGQVIGDGRYEVREILGRGGMGTVWLAWDRQLERLVAVKSMNADLLPNEDLRQRFVKEAKLVAQLRHPNIGDVYAFCDEPSGLYIVFAYIKGRTLYDLLCESPGRHLDTAYALELGLAIAKAIDYAHSQDVIHRDLKPGNVMIDEHGVVKVMDFGIARRLDNAQTTVTKISVGTPAYMAPEQARGVVTKQSDVFSFGVIMYEVLTGRRPFNGMDAQQEMLEGRFTPPSQLLPSPAPAVDEVFKMVLHPDHRQRHESGMKFWEALKAAMRLPPPAP